MNNEQKARVIANCEVIAKALRTGATLQFRSKYSVNAWRDDPLYSLNVDDHLEYRLKPEPRTIWVNEYDGKEDVVHTSEENAREGAYKTATRIAVEYREVVKP